MNIKNTDIAVIGGGASGIAAAIGCAEGMPKKKTVIIEKQTRIGRKLLASGNGRCNITNRNAAPNHYYGDKKIIASVLDKFSPSDCESFFNKMGVLFRDEGDGRVYPYSNRASTVLDCMRMKCRSLGVEELCDFSVLSIKKHNGRFIISSPDMRVSSEYLVFATGSKASPHLGADESGYKLLDSLGIKHTVLYPSLSPVHTKENYKYLKGARTKGDVSLICDGKRICVRSGEIQFTDYGLSGICVFEISRLANEFLRLGTVFGKRYNNVKLSCDIMSEYTFGDLCAYIRECKKIFTQDKARYILSAALDKKLSQSVAEYCGLSDKLCGSLTDGDIKKLAGAVKGFAFTPKMSADDYKSAQVTAGGVNSAYVNAETLMSYRLSRLFVCGELLDVDGECGGYNLHFAVGSGLYVSRVISELERR